MKQLQTDKTDEKYYENKTQVEEGKKKPFNVRFSHYIVSRWLIFWEWYSSSIPMQLLHGLTFRAS